MLSQSTDVLYTSSFGHYIASTEVLSTFFCHSERCFCHSKRLFPVIPSASEESSAWMLHFVQHDKCSVIPSAVFVIPNALFVIPSTCEESIQR